MLSHSVHYDASEVMSLVSRIKFLEAPFYVNIFYQVSRLLCNKTFLNYYVKHSKHLFHEPLKSGPSYPKLFLYQRTKPNYNSGMATKSDKSQKI